MGVTALGSTKSTTFVTSDPSRFRSPKFAELGLLIRRFIGAMLPISHASMRIRVGVCAREERRFSGARQSWTGGRVSTEPVEYHEQGDIAFITLNRPEKLNALNPRVFELLDDFITRFADDDSLKVAVLHGNGTSFAAGADIEHYVDIDAVQYLDFMRSGNGVQLKYSQCPKPVIAAVHGYALGGGLELALACDFIVAAPDAQMGLPEVRLGLLPGGGGTQRLPRLIGTTRTAEILMTAKRFSGDQAVEWGMALGLGDHEDALAAATALAERIALQAVLPIRMAKVLLRSGADASLDAAMDLEQSMGAMIFTTADAREGIRAFVEKRRPEFKGN